MATKNLDRHDVAIVGGGIVGLSVALALSERQPRLRLVVIEKENAWAQHQTGRNSGVLHSGIYYKPGSLKARLCREGRQRMIEFCAAHGVPHEICGKVIVATDPAELPRLAALEQRAADNDLEARRLSREAVREREPHVACLAGLLVPSTGIVSFAQVCRKLADLIAGRGGQLQLGTRVVGIQGGHDSIRLQTNRGVVETARLINCAGLHSDRIARLAGARPEARIVPFRGEYYELKPERRSLVKHLVYPVPNPDFPFLGVHFTRMIDGSVHAGPNAVLSFKREGYRRTDFNLRDLLESLLFPGFWRLAWRNAREGIMEMRRSLSKRLFVRTLQRLVPDIRAEDLVPAEAGVRAQALRRDGALEDDFLIVRGPRAWHVCNAPSPAATASLEIGRVIAEQWSTEAE